MPIGKQSLCLSTHSLHLPLHFFSQFGWELERLAGCGSGFPPLIACSVAGTFSCSIFPASTHWVGTFFTIMWSSNEIWWELARILLPIFHLSHQCLTQYQTLKSSRLFVRRKRIAQYVTYCDFPMRMYLPLVLLKTVSVFNTNSLFSTCCLLLKGKYRHPLEQQSC